MVIATLESKPQTGTGLYNNLDELCERLALLIGSRKAGNDSREVYNEIMDILDVLLKNNVINLKEHKTLFVKYLMYK